MYLFVRLLGEVRQESADPVSSSTSAGSSTVTSATNTTPSPTPTTRLLTGILTLTQTPRESPTAVAATPSATPAPVNGPSTNTTTSIIAIVVVAVVILLSICLYISLRRVRRKHKNPKYVPTPFLKKAWRNWEPQSSYFKKTSSHLEPTRTNRSSTAPANFDATAARSTTNGANTAAVDRNTSVRSVMTLPAYHQNALHNEQVLGREGDRGGIDIVIEHPETIDEEEMRREEEMEALYQVRLARRRENEEREERRRLRREARERGDYVALREIQARARAASSSNANQSVEELRAEHDRIKKERQRAVSSVSYGDLGVARHDGTRIRANSNESERQGLLGDAASIAASSHYHRRDRSAGSILTIDTTTSDLPEPGFTRSRGNSRASLAESTLRIDRTSTNDEGRAGSSPEMINHEDMPPNSPPGYENVSLDTPQEPRHQEPPPDYTSPVVDRAEQFPTLEAELPLPNSERGQTASERRQSVGSRRSSATHISDLMSQSRTSSSGSAHLATTRNPIGDRHSSRGVGGVPQLPSLRLASLPSIQVDPGSPVVRRIDEDPRAET